jgi:hypothetical protein
MHQSPLILKKNYTQVQTSVKKLPSWISFVCGSPYHGPLRLFIYGSLYHVSLTQNLVWVAPSLISSSEFQITTTITSKNNIDVFCVKVTLSSPPTQLGLILQHMSTSHQISLNYDTCHLWSPTKTFKNR